MKEHLLIFDMDGTLYDLNDVVQMSYDMQVDFYCKKESISREETIFIFTQNHIYPKILKDSKSATEFFLQNGIDKREWAIYREQFFDVSKIQTNKAVGEYLLREFAQFGRLVLLSSNAFRIILKILDHIQISPEIFDKIICSDLIPSGGVFNKKMAMEYLLTDYGIRPCDLLSIGDRYNTDIVPAIELGGKGALLRNPESLNTLLADMKKNNLHSNNKYEYYDN